MKKVAIFDVDGTIFRSSLIIELVENLIDKGLFPKSARAEYQREKVRWLDRKGDYQSYINALVKSFVTHIKGVPYGEFKDVTKDVIDAYKDRTYRYTRDLVKDLKKKDYFLLAISHSPKAILDEFCTHLGFDKVYGKIYEIGPSDCFTGKILDEHLIMNKAAVVKRAVEKEGLTLKGSYGVGDTESDIPFLEVVENPICFNPNQKLFKHAKLNSWRVVVERKDMIYEL